MIFILLLFLFFPLTYAKADINFEKTNVKSISSISDSIETQGINIENDTAFNLYGLLGNGTANNPYLIENFIITTTNPIGIAISQTTKYFIVRNCTIDSTGGIGLSLYYIGSGTGQIINNTITGTPSEAIHIDGSNDLILKDNHIINNNAGLFAGVTSNISMIGNFIYSNNYNGLYFLDSTNIFLSNNTIFNNSAAGINLINDQNIGLNQNLINNNTYGLTLGNTSLSIITNNIFKFNLAHALVIDDNSSNNLVYLNQFDNNLVKPQASDDGNQNLFYNSTSKKGNYWSDYESGGVYNITGLANNFDLYPLTKEGLNVASNGIGLNIEKTTVFNFQTQTQTVSVSDDIWQMATIIETVLLIIIIGVFTALYIKRKRLIK